MIAPAVYMTPFFFTETLYLRSYGSIIILKQRLRPAVLPPGSDTYVSSAIRLCFNTRQYYLVFIPINRTGVSSRICRKAQGKSWKMMPVPKLRVSDLDAQALDYFRKESVKRGRLTSDEVSVNDELLLDNLRLIDEEGYLIRAAVIAFYNDPEIRC